MHRLLGLPNQFGLSDLIRGLGKIESISQHTTNLKNVTIVTSGSLPPNPTELLASARMEKILLEAERESDIVILDSPPALVADVQVMAAKVDGVLLVVYPGHTQAEAALAAREQLSRAGARIIGVVLNRIPRNRSYYYGGYKYYSPYGESKDYFSGNGSKPVKQPAEPVEPYISEAFNPSYKLTGIFGKTEDIQPPDPSKD
jgi:capsular exopolysaccharide synthesis family protein